MLTLSIMLPCNKAAVGSPILDLNGNLDALLCSKDILSFEIKCKGIRQVEQENIKKK